MTSVNTRQNTMNTITRNSGYARVDDGEDIECLKKSNTTCIVKDLIQMKIKGPGGISAIDAAVLKVTQKNAQKSKTI